MNILYYRKKRHMTQKELAAAVGVTQAYIHALETGKRKNPSLQVLMKIAEALNVTANRLLSSCEKAV